MNFDPRGDLDAAYRVGVLPAEHRLAKHRQLLERGFQAWERDGELDENQLVKDVEIFGRLVLKDSIDRDHASNPIAEDPGILAVVATLSAVCIKRHERLTSTPPEKLVPLRKVRELYSEALIGLVGSYQNRTTVLEDITEVLYEKSAGEDGPHPGRVCTGIRRFDGNPYLEIPLPAASRKCMVRRSVDGDLGGGYSNEEKRATGEFASKIEDNAVYVPIQDCLKKVRERHKRGFPILLSSMEDLLPDVELARFAEKETKISEEIDHLFRIGHKELIWEDWNPQQAKYNAIRTAILESETIQFNEYYPVKDILEAIRTFEPQDRWKASQLAQITSRRSLGNTLSNLSKDFPIEVEVKRGSPNRYKFDRSPTGSDLEVNEIEDLFELPCLANMDERLQNKGPVRKDLYSFVRLVTWLPQYRDAPTEVIVEDLKEVFQRWPWYDEQETEYQIRYELSNTIEGEPPLPMNCDNDDMQRYCIGQEECPFSIYGSVPFSTELYDHLGQDEQEF